MKFTGELAKPIIARTRSVTLLTDTPEGRAKIKRHNDEEIQRVVHQSLKKMDLLCEKFEIPTDTPSETKYIFMTILLAREFVPGFKVKNLSISRGKGRIKEWSVIKYAELLADAELLKSEKHRSDSEVCRILTSSSRFAARWEKYNARTLLNRLIEARQEKKNALMALKNVLLRENPQRSAEIARIFIESFSITGSRS